MTDSQLTAVAGILTAFFAGLIAMIKLVLDYRLRKVSGDKDAPITPEDAAKATVITEADRLGIAITPEQWGSMFANSEERHQSEIRALKSSFKETIDELTLAHKQEINDLVSAHNELAKKLDARITGLESEREEDRNWIRSVIPWALANNYVIPVPYPGWYAHWPSDFKKNDNS